MKPEQLLSASLTDILFEGRNKQYGAYELRCSDARRTNQALAVTIALAALALSFTTLAGAAGEKKTKYKMDTVVELKNLPREKPPEKLPEPKPREQTPAMQTQKFTLPEILPDELVTEPLPPVDDLADAKIDTFSKDGLPYDGTAREPEPPGDGKGVIPPREEKDPEEPAGIVDVPAKFIGNWIQFLRRNLDAETPVRNDAPPGRYSVVVKFVVDKEGQVSDILALTRHGYGLEEEAVRVLRKAPKWEPAVFNGYKVKAFHKQVIVFEVLEE